MPRNSHGRRSIKNVFFRKTPALEFLFNKVDPTQVLFCEYCKIFKDTYLEEHLRKATSECRLQQQ